MLRVLLLGILAVQSACESCEFSFGALQVGGRLAVKGEPPADLAVRACTSPDGDECEPPARLYDAGDGLRYETSIPSVGTVTCNYDHRFLRVTGTGCTTVVIAALASTELGDDHRGDPTVPDLAALDLVVACSGEQ